jgi:hypothetical protein
MVVSAFFLPCTRKKYPTEKSVPFSPSFPTVQVLCYPPETV